MIRENIKRDTGFDVGCVTVYNDDHHKVAHIDEDSPLSNCDSVALYASTLEVPRLDISAATLQNKGSHPSTYGANHAQINRIQNPEILPQHVKPGN